MVNALLDPVTGGGTAERTFHLARLLGERGTDVGVLTLDVGLTAERKQALADVRLTALPCLLRRFYLPRPSLDRIYRAVAAADVVHVMGHWTVINALAVLAAKRAGKPWVVCPAGALPIVGRSGALKRLYNAVIGRRIVREASGHVAITRDELPAFSSYGVDPAKVVVIPNGVSLIPEGAADASAFRARHRLGSRRIILFMGRLSYIKGPDLLLEAFLRALDSLPAHDLVFAGPDDGLLGKLQATAARAGASGRVRFVGYVGGADKEAAYAASDLLVVPSRKEAMSLVAIEAGIRGKPVLLTDQCGFDEVEAAGGGRVVPARSDALGEALVSLLSDRGALAARGAAMREFVRRDYLWDTAVARYLELFRQITRQA
jgi:glycosyltransferase involved in cell wall biosynthesis